MQKRSLEVVVISDVHLGTVGCHAVELTQYLNSIDPKTLILNGDIIDIWNFRKHYWPEAHMRVVKLLLILKLNDWLSTNKPVTLPEIADTQSITENLIKNGCR